LLPASEELATGQAAQVDNRQLRGHETILVVEDEEAMREVIRRVLERGGYQVLIAANGTEALALDADANRDIALLLTDLVMPDGLGGIELAARLRHERPALKVVLTSGYANEMTGQAFRLPSGAHFIQKPYKPQSLAQMVRDALDDRFDR
jgi:hypothetical protein